MPTFSAAEAIQSQLLGYAFSRFFTHLDLELLSSECKSPLATVLTIWELVYGELEVETVKDLFYQSLSSIQAQVLTVLRDWWSRKYEKAILSNASVLIWLSKAYENDYTYSACSRPHTIDQWLYKLMLVEFLPIMYSGLIEVTQRQLTTLRTEAIRWTSWLRIALYTSNAYHPDDTGWPGSRPSILNPCPWRQPQDVSSQRRRLPTYLWDRLERRTVKTDTLLESTVDYVCISHTWGRWYTGNVLMEGVPWPVPSVSMFDFNLLPDQLASLDWPVRYLWIDIFCIPQMGRKPDLNEIHRQPQYFANAHACVVWLNDVTGWERMQYISKWLCAHLLGLPEMVDCGHSPEYQSLCDFRTAFNPSDMVPSDQKDVFEPKWFTSLWTLQEVFIRPDALLADRNWELLTTVGGCPLTFDNLQTMACSPGIALHSCPTSVKSLRSLFKRAGLEQLESANETVLLMAAAKRSATGDRSHAVMSAMFLGHPIGQWLSKLYQHHSSSLVIGLFSTKLLQMAINRIGPQFFMTIKQPPDKIADISSTTLPNSLLPFPNTNAPKQQVHLLYANERLSWNYSGVNGWQVQSDGSFCVSEATVLNHSNRSVSQENNHCDGPMWLYRGFQKKHCINFRDAVENVDATGPCVAVLLGSTKASAFGLILQGLPSTKTSRDPRFVRVALFESIGVWISEVPLQAQKVKWVVV